MRKKAIKNENYLEKIPVHPQSIKWTSDEDGIVTLDIENKGFFKYLTQVLIKKPRVSHIHLDELGSFIWTCIDGERDLVKIGEALKEKFGDKAEPVYERLTKYFRMLESYKFINWNN